MPDTQPENFESKIPLTQEGIQAYLDAAIESWREYRQQSKDWMNTYMANCYIDAYQSVRSSLFGEILPS